VHDLQGRRLALLAEGVMDAGSHETSWDGRDCLGRELSSGVYFLHLKTADEERSQKLVLLR